MLAETLHKPFRKAQVWNEAGLVFLTVIVLLLFSIFLKAKRREFWCTFFQNKNCCWALPLVGNTICIVTCTKEFYGPDYFVKMETLLLARLARIHMPATKIPKQNKTLKVFWDLSMYAARRKWHDGAVPLLFIELLLLNVVWRRDYNVSSWVCCSHVTHPEFVYDNKRCNKMGRFLYRCCKIFELVPSLVCRPGEHIYFAKSGIWH